MNRFLYAYKREFGEWEGCPIDTVQRTYKACQDTVGKWADGKAAQNEVEVVNMVKVAEHFRIE